MRRPTVAVLVATLVCLFLAANAQAGLLSWWRFEETDTSQPAADSSGNARHGTYQGTVTLGNPGPTTIAGNAAGFQNGSPAGSVAVPELGTNLQEFTIQAWVKPDDKKTWDVVYNVDGWSGGYLHYQFLNNGRIRFSVNGIGDRDYGSNDSIPMGDWTHLVATYDNVNKVQRVYANGECIGVCEFTQNRTANLRAAHLGAWRGSGRYFDG